MAPYVIDGYVVDGYTEGGSEPYVIDGYVVDGYTEGGSESNTSIVIMPNTIPILNSVSNNVLISIHITNITITTLLPVIVNDNIVIYSNDINVQLHICKLNNILLPRKGIFDTEYITPTVVINQGVSNIGKLLYNNTFSDTINGSMSTEWVTWAIATELKNLHGIVVVTLCGGLCFDVFVTSVVVEEIYRGALWYNVKLKYIKRIE